MGFFGPVVCFLPFRHTQGREGFNFPEKFFTVVLGPFTCTGQDIGQGEK